MGHYVLIQDGDDRSRKDFWVHFGIGADTSAHLFVIQINTSINLGHGFKKANADDSFFRCSVKTTFLNVADITYGML